MLRLLDNCDTFTLDERELQDIKAILCKGNKEFYKSPRDEIRMNINYREENGKK